MSKAGAGSETMGKNLVLDQPAGWEKKKVLSSSKGPHTDNDALMVLHIWS